MAQIFISHSGKDKDLVNFFSRAGAGTKVKLVFEEFEKIVGGNINAQQIRKDIAESNAVFIILSMQVATIPHTRDWILWESGTKISGHSSGSQSWGAWR